MKRKNLFDLLALKEKISSNKYLLKMQPLKEEKNKIEQILIQLNELKNEDNSNQSTSAWELKSASNIQEKIFEQISLADLRLKNINHEIFVLEQKFSMVFFAHSENSLSLKILDGTLKPFFGFFD